MGAIAIVACPGCGQQVRLPSDLGTIHATCPKCRSSWDWADGNITNIVVVVKPPAPPSVQSQTRPSSAPSAGDNTAFGIGFAVLVAVCVVGFLIYRGLTYSPPKPLPESQPNQKAPEGRKAIWDLPPEQPLPANGYGVYNFDKANTASTLQIDSRAGQGHLIVKLERPENKEVVCWFLIHEGQSHRTPFPPGQYRMKLASGKTWYGEKHLFGPNASYSTITELITLPERTNYTISLTPNVMGTLKDRPIGTDDF